MDYLKRAYSQSCRLADLINDISTLTKIEEAASLYQIEKVNLEELVLDIAGELKPELEENGIVLDLKMTKTWSLMVIRVFCIQFSVIYLTMPSTMGAKASPLELKIMFRTGNSIIFHFTTQEPAFPRRICPGCLSDFTGLTKAVTVKKGVPDSGWLL